MKVSGVHMNISTIGTVSKNLVRNLKDVEIQELLSRRSQHYLYQLEYTGKR